MAGKKLIRKLAPMAAAMCLSGCLGVHLGVGGGGGSRTSVRESTQTYDTTLGQQLLDLKKAYDSGVISEREYNAERKRLLKHYLPR